MNPRESCRDHVRKARDHLLAARSLGSQEAATVLEAIDAAKAASRDALDALDASDRAEKGVRA